MSRELDELRRALRRVMWGLRRRQWPSRALVELLEGEPPLGPRHVAVLAHVATEGEQSVGEIARELGLSLPAASKLARDLEEHRLVARREHPDDRRRTVVGLDDATRPRIEAWLAERNRPLERALAALAPAERAAFLKGLDALAEALMEESACGSVRPHHRAPARRGPHRHRPV